MKLICTQASQVLGARLAGRLGVETIDVKYTRFPDGESSLIRDRTDDETAIAMGISPRTVHRDWDAGREWLAANLA